MTGPGTGASLTNRVKAVQNLVRQTADAALRREAGLTLAQYVVLRELAADPGLSAAELARRTFVTRQSLRDVLGGLIAGELITETAPAAGRARPLAPTAEGEQRRATGATVMTRIDRHMVTGLTAAEQTALAQALDRCIANLTAL